MGLKQLIDENVAPIPKPNVDIISMSPTAEQYFLFSRVDGKLTVAQLCQSSGLGRESTLDCLEYLASAGAIELPGFEVDAPAAEDESPAVAPSNNESPTVAAETTNASPEAPAAKPAAPTVEKTPAAQSAHVIPNYPIPPEQFDFDPELLAHESPLDDGLRRELICLYAQLEQMSYYDLFGLSIGAGRKEIKKAYFRLSKRHHPDNFFRQDLGPLGKMQETVFKEIARAYATLSKKGARRDYDAALSAHLAEQSGGAAESAPVEAAESGAAGASQDELRERNKRKAAGALLVRRAEKYQERGDYAQAAEEYRKALALVRDPQLAMRVADIMFSAAKMPKEAACFARAGLKLGAPPAEAHFIVGCALQSVGAEREAVKEFQKVLAHAPGHPGATERLGQFGAR